MHRTVFLLQQAREHTQCTSFRNQSNYTDLPMDAVEAKITETEIDPNGNHDSEGLSNFQIVEIDKEYEEILDTIQDDLDYKPQIMEIDIGKTSSEPGISRSGVLSSGRRSAQNSSRRNSKSKKSSKPPSETSSNPASSRRNSTSPVDGAPNLGTQPESVHEDASLGGSIIELTKFTKKSVPNKTALMESVIKAEEKLKLREQIKISILKISLSKLMKVHRFVKNQPWVKVQYARHYDWSVDLSDPTCDPTIKPTTAQYDGTHASWIDLKWSFVLERNQSERNDLVFTVCSKEYIMGRYILSKNDWQSLPTGDKAGFFTVSGEIVNGLGTAGVIHILCQRTIIEKASVTSGFGGSPQKGSRNATVERFIQSKFLEKEKEKEEKQAKLNSLVPNASAAPNKSTKSKKSMASETLDEDDDDEEEKYTGGAIIGGNISTEKDLIHPGNSAVPDVYSERRKFWNFTHVAVRVLSIAIMDCKSMHLLESNSPCITIESGSYIFMTERIRNAGMAARWNNLLWKLLISRDHGMIITVQSYSNSIGKLFISTEELLSASALDHKEIVSVIKHISNGKEITGKCKLNMIINHPDDILTNLISKENVMQPLQQGSLMTGGTSMTTTKILPPDENGVMEVKDETFGDELPEGLRPLTATTDTTDAIQDLTMIPEVRLPFNIIVQEVVIIDITLPSMQQRFVTNLFMQRNFTLQCVCGNWADITPEINTASLPNPFKPLASSMTGNTMTYADQMGGIATHHNQSRYVHWLQLKWCIPVTNESVMLRMNLRCNQQSIGQAVISVPDLLSMPRDFTGRTEIFVKLINDKNPLMIIGKLRLTCRYENVQHVIVANSFGDLPAATNDFTGGPGNSSILDALNTKNSRSLSPFKLPVIANKFKSLVSLPPNNESGYPPDTPGPLTTSMLNSSAEGEGILMHLGEGSVNTIGLGNHTMSVPLFLTLPVFARIHTIALLDLVSIHTVQANSPQIQLICDRKSAKTPISKLTGAVAKWENINWVLKLRADTAFTINVLSNNQFVGRIDFTPQSIISNPVTPDGFLEISGMLMKNENQSSGRIVLVLQLRQCDLVNYQDLKMESGDNNSIFPTDESVLGPAGIPEYGLAMGGALEGSFTGAGHEGSYLVGQQPSANTLHSSPSYPLLLTQNGVRPSSGQPREASTTLFDPLLMNDPMTIPGYGIGSSGNPTSFVQFKVMIRDIDIWDLEASASNFLSLTGKPFLQITGACGKWICTTTTECEIVRESTKRYFWKRVGWIVMIKDFSAKLRFTIAYANHSTDQSKGKPPEIVGHASFSLDELRTSTADELGVKRVVGNIFVNDPSYLLNQKDTNNNTSPSKIRPESDRCIGKFKLGFAMEAMRIQTTSSNASSRPLSAAQRPPSAGGNHPSSFMQQQQQQSRMMSNSPSRAVTPVGPPGTGNDYYPSGFPPAQNSLEAAASFVSDFGYTMTGPGGQPGGPPQQQQQPPPNHAPEGMGFPYQESLSLMEPSQDDDDYSPMITFPCSFTIVEMATMELISVHSFKKNNPVIKVFCHNFYQSTPTAMDANSTKPGARNSNHQQSPDMATFRNLHWIFPVQANSMIKFSVFSEKIEIGMIEFPIIDIIEAPLNNKRLKDIVLPITNKKGMITGKVYLAGNFSPLESVYFDEHVTKRLLEQSSSMVEGSFSNQGTGILGSSATMTSFGIQNQAMMGGQGGPQTFNQQMSNLFDRSMNSEDMTYEALQTMKSASVFSKNKKNSNDPGIASAPNLQLMHHPMHLLAHGGNTNPGMEGQQGTFALPMIGSRPNTGGGGGGAGNNNNTSGPILLPGAANMTNSGRYAGMPPNSAANNRPQSGSNQQQMNNNNSNNNNAPYPFMDRSEYSEENTYAGYQTVGTMRTGMVGGGANTGSVTAAAVLANAQQQQQQQRVRSAGGNGNLSRIPSGELMIGGGGLNNGLQHPSISSASFSSPSPMTPLPQQATVPGGLQQQSSSVMQNTISLEDNINYPITIQIVGIAAIDLPSVHTFTTNTPICSIACGRFTAATDALQQNGTTATWENLTWTFPFDKHAKFRLLLTSKDKFIGGCNLTRIKFLYGKQSLDHSLIVFGELINQMGQPSGKVKLIYNVLGS